MIDYLKDNILVESLIAVVVAIVVYCFTQRSKERHKQKLPVLEELSNLLKETERVISCFAGKRTTKVVRSNRTKYHGNYTSGGVTIHNGEEVFNNVDGCSGPLSWKETTQMLYELQMFSENRFLPYVALDCEKEKLIQIQNSLKDFVYCLKEFNKRWPGFPPGPSITQLEKKNGVSLFGEARKIESKANLIKQQIIELKKQVDGMMKPRWYKMF
ncbi:MAG: hypothetical protein NOU37_07740 [Candidatus Brocadiales bacterium]|nr:hypothetical protein [Candidatus Bathyanammoxibius amoris]